MGYYDEDSGDSEAQMPQQQYPYIPGYTMQNSNLIDFALTHSDLIEGFRRRLLALEYNETQKEWVRSQVYAPLINEEGATKVLTLVESIVNRNTNLSNIEEDRLKLIAKEVEEKVNENFLDNWDRYWKFQSTDTKSDIEMQAKSNWSMIRAMTGNFAMISLLRAQNGGERNILGGNTRTLIQKSEVDSSQRISEAKQGGFIPRIFK